MHFVTAESQLSQDVSTFIIGYLKSYQGAINLISAIITRFQIPVRSFNKIPKRIYYVKNCTSIFLINKYQYKIFNYTPLWIEKIIKYQVNFNYSLTRNTFLNLSII